MEHTKQLLSINLANLVQSHRNVRRHSTMQVEELAALIDAQGRLHNLVVTEQVVGRGKARKLKFAIAAGERRRRALLLLQQRGRLPKSHEVLCKRVPSARALEVSVAENSGREALHPADEFSAGPEKQEMNQRLGDFVLWAVFSRCNRGRLALPAAISVASATSLAGTSRQRTGTRAEVSKTAARIFPSSTKSAGLVR